LIEEGLLGLRHLAQSQSSGTAPMLLQPADLSIGQHLQRDSQQCPRIFGLTGNGSSTDVLPTYQLRILKLFLRAEKGILV